MEQIKLLLASTGLSADDLIKKLSEYKALERRQDLQITKSSEVNVINEVNTGLFTENPFENLKEDENIGENVTPINKKIELNCLSIAENLDSQFQREIPAKENVVGESYDENVKNTDESSQDSSMTTEYIEVITTQECIEINQDLHIKGNEEYVCPRNESENFEFSKKCMEKEPLLEIKNVQEMSEDTSRNLESSDQETTSTGIIELSQEAFLEDVEKSHIPVQKNIHLEEISCYFQDTEQPIEQTINNNSVDSLQNLSESQEDKITIEEIEINESEEDLINNEYIVEECGELEEQNTQDSIRSSEEETLQFIEITHQQSKYFKGKNDLEDSQDSIICIEECDGNVFLNNNSIKETGKFEEFSQSSFNSAENIKANVSEKINEKDSNIVELPSQNLQENVGVKVIPDDVDIPKNSARIIKSENKNLEREIVKNENVSQESKLDYLFCEGTSNGIEGMNEYNNTTEDITKVMDDLEEDDAIIVEEIEVECNEKFVDLSSEKKCNVNLENKFDKEKNLYEIYNLNEKSTTSIPSTSRLKITSLIEERLNSEKNVSKSNTDFIDLSKEDTKLSHTMVIDNSSEVKRQPILGYIRKSQNKDGSRKRIRTSKPPWLMEQSDEESNSSIVNEVKVDNMRAEIFNQLKQLRQKKEPEPLVINPIPRLYIKRTNKKVDKTDSSDTHLGLKIVNVKGGCHDIEDIQINPKKIKSSDCKIINEDLESNVITLTKTMDYKKIKGWQNKKLLIEKAENIPQIIAIDNASEANKKSLFKDVLICDEGPSCSYSVPKQMSQIVENNVFASNNLDGFLDEQRDLNISYDVPNLTSSSKVDFLDSTVIPNPQKEVAQESKRRFKIAENEETSCINQNVRSDPYKPRTLAEKRKLMELTEKPSNKKINQDKSEDAKTLSLEESIPSNLIYSSVYYKGRKYKAASSSFKSIYIDNKVKKKPKKQYKYVEVKKNLKKKVQETTENACEKRKPSIYLKKLQSKPNLTYKPGPLCKKISLQNGTSSKWKSVVKKLPSIYLEIYPHFGKKLHPKAQEVINFDRYDISEERLEFALSALSTEPPKSPIQIPIPYKHNQTCILLQQPVLEKREIPGLINIKDIKQEETSILDSVQSILNDLITCIENKEIENIIIKDDPDVIFKEETIESDIKPKFRIHRTDVIKGTSKKTSLELKRLNVKFIEVNIDDSEHKPAICSKPYCHLGCVCKSLSSVPIPPDHCGEAKCIFVCHCGFDKKKTDSLKFVVPPGTDILSDRTVSRLQDEAKKDLAKVEKEFTQTVIHAYNQTIVVGDKTNRKRRATKVPKKYEDYLEPQIIVENQKLEDMEEEEILLTPIESPKPPSSPIPQQNKECYIRLSNLDLKHLMPYCLEHNLYNCHCNFEAEYTKLPCQDKSLDVQPKKVINRRPKPLFVDLKRSTRETKKPARYEKALTERNNCARTKGAPTTYYSVRNRTATFRQKLARKLKIENDNVSINLKQWLDQGENIENEVKSTEVSTMISKPDIKLELKTELTYDPLLEPIGISSLAANKPSRRKQHLQVREETTNIAVNNHTTQTIEPALQRRKKVSKKLEDFLNTNTPIEINGSIIKSLTANDMVTPNPSLSKKFSEMLSDTGSCNQFRLIQWSTIIKIYEQKLIQIWFAPFHNKIKFIITDSDKKFVTGYQNVRQFEEYKHKKKLKIDLIRWIVTRKAPGDNGDDLLVILKMRPTFLEICGICSKNRNKKMKIEAISDNTFLKAEKLSSKKMDSKIIDPNLIVNRPFEITPVESQLIKVIPPQVNVTPIKNEEKKEKVDIPSIAKVPNEFKTVQQVIFSQGDFIQKKLVPIETNGENILTVHCLDPESMDAALPNVPICKWRMLKVNSNFSILSFKRNQFRIKCSDIITVMKVSQRIGKTIIINTEDISLNYQHKLFGIYIVPNYSDRIFIGPYFCYENHDLETLRFVNNVLINTEVFNKMQKTGPQNTTGVWYQQLMKKGRKLEKSASYIDLTETEDSGKKNENIFKKTASNSPRSILKTSFLNANLSSSATLEPIIEKPTVELHTSSNIDLEKLYFAKLKVAMKHLNLALPANAIPISFKVNFDNGLIHGYRYKDKGNIYVYWPGDFSTTSCKIFRNMEIAIEWLQLELKSVFILVPITFEIKVELVDRNDYMSIMSKASMSKQYFKDVYIIGNFGALKMIEVAEHLMKNPHLSLEHDDINDQLKLKTESSDFKTALLQFLDDDIIQYMDFLNKCMLQIKVQIGSELIRSRKLSETKTTLELKKIELLKTHSALLKQADKNLQEKIHDEFMNCWVHPKSTSKLEKIKSDVVICLDSDDEESNKQRKKNNIAAEKSNNKNGKHFNSNRRIKAKITKSNCKLKITSMDFNRIESLKKEEEDPLEMKRKHSPESVTLSSKKIKMLDDLFIESKTSTQTNCADVEKIDLSHISVDKVRSLLGANIRGNRLTLTQAQLNSLKALSDRNKCKWLSVSQDNSASEENKAECS